MPTKKEATQPEPTTVPEESTQFGGPADHPVIEQKPFNRILVFTSPVCGPCKQLKPLLATIDQETPFLHEVVSFDAKVNGDLFAQFGVRNVPAMVHVRTEYNGAELIETVLDRVTGYDGEKAVRAKLQEWGYFA